jgi:hypothetical protein
MKKLNQLVDFDYKWVMARYPQLKALNPTPAKMNLEQKVELLFLMVKEPSHQYRFYNPSDNYSDAWNRKGMLLMEFRKNCLEEITGQKFPSLADFGSPKSFRGTDGEAFLKALWTAPGFKEAYEQVDWTSATSRKAFESAVQKGAKASQSSSEQPKSEAER